jgi:hypothetical protein
MKRKSRFNLLLLEEGEVYFDVCFHMMRYRYIQWNFLLLWRCCVQEYIATLIDPSDPKGLPTAAASKRDDRSKLKYDFIWIFSLNSVSYLM